jgi:hypothetical protein
VLFESRSLASPWVLSRAVLTLCLSSVVHEVQRGPGVELSKPRQSHNAQHPAHSSGPGVASSLESWGLDYAFTSAPCGAWLGMSSWSSLVRRAWAKPSPTITAMIPESAKAAMAHQKAISAIKLKP